MKEKQTQRKPILTIDGELFKRMDLLHSESDAINIFIRDCILNLSEDMDAGRYSEVLIKLGEELHKYSKTFSNLLGICFLESDDGKLQYKLRKDIDTKVLKNDFKLLGFDNKINPIYVHKNLKDCSVKRADERKFKDFITNKLYIMDGIVISYLKDNKYMYRVLGKVWLKDDPKTKINAFNGVYCKTK